MNEMQRFGDVREKALLEREEGLAEGVAELRGASLDRRVDFLREVPGAKGALVDELLADIRNLQEGRSIGTADEAAAPARAPKASMRRGGILLGLILGLMAGVAGGAGGAWVMLEGSRGAAHPVPTVVQVPAPAPVSRWASSEEEDLYLRLSRSNGGMALAAHCRGDGKVEVETSGGRRDACLAWPPAE